MALLVDACTSEWVRGAFLFRVWAHGDSTVWQEPRMYDAD